MMTKTYKHIKTGMLVEWYEELPGVVEVKNEDVIKYLPYKIVKDSQDREEVVEKDWITDAINSYEASYYSTESRKDELRKAIEQHMPKVKKFSREGVAERYRGIDGLVCYSHVIDFLQVNGLLEE